MTPCENIRRRLVHLALGQLESSERDAIQQHVQSCAACRHEAASITSTVLALRQAPSLKASPRFRATLERRLDRLEESEAEHTLSGLEGVHFRILLFQHRLRTSRRLRWQLAAAGILFLLGGFMAFSNGRPPASPPVPVALPLPEPTPLDPTDVSPPSADPRKEQRQLEQFLERQFADAHRPDVSPYEPVFPDSPEPTDPLLPERAPAPRPVADLEPLPDSTPNDLPRRPEPPVARGGTEEPTPRVEPIQGVADSVHRGLRWLARQQREDGLWSAGDGDADLIVASSGAALLAFLSDGVNGRGVTPQAATVRRGIAALLEQVNADGSIGQASDPAAQCLNQALACLALTEHFLLQGTDADAGTLAVERTVIVDGLDYLERRFLDLFRDRPELRRGSGENAAWVALALLTARRSGCDWNLSADLDDRIERMLVRLRNQSSEMEVARGHALMAMVAPVNPDRGGAPFSWSDEWQQAITPVLANPVKAPPSLRFLVAAALCPWDPSEPATRLWDRYQPQLERALLSVQDPTAGYFEAHQIGAFDGGVVFHTALCVVTLNMPQRAERLRQAVQARSAPR